VRGIVSSERDQAFVTAMTDLARRLSIAVIAEQVETEDQGMALLKLGVEYAQGYLFGRPGQLPTPLVGAPAKRRTGTR
jgi:EAL domain-containing protein (putative c-di-GMP-specific phosphodiesterase class I)